jgi:hypothetical protein
LGTFNSGDVTCKLSNGDTLKLGSTGGGYALDQFFGVTDTKAFTSILPTIDGSDPPPGDDVLSLNDVTSGSISAFPEASAWALMIVGFVGVSFMAYRRRNDATIAA